MLDLRTMDTGAGSQIQHMWIKFKPVIEEYRRNGDYPPNRYIDFEFVAGKLREYNRRRGDVVEGRMERLWRSHIEARQS